MKFKMFILAVFAFFGFSTAMAWEVVIDIDDPDAVVLTDENKQIPLVKGENRIEFNEYESYYLNPKEGYTVSDLVSYTPEGKKDDLSGWTFNVWNGEYSTFFIKQNDGCRYVFTTAKVQ